MLRRMLCLAMTLLAASVGVGQAAPVDVNVTVDLSGAVINDWADSEDRQGKRLWFAEPFGPHVEVAAGDDVVFHVRFAQGQRVVLHDLGSSFNDGDEDVSFSLWSFDVIGDEPRAQSAYSSSTTPTVSFIDVVGDYLPDGDRASSAGGGPAIGGWARGNFTDNCFSFTGVDLTGYDISSMSPNPGVFGSWFTGDLVAEDIRVEIVPEPASLLAIGIGLIGIAGFGRRARVRP